MNGDRILQLEAKRAQKRELDEKIKRGDESVSEKDKIVASLTHGKIIDRAEEQDATTASSSGSKLQFSRFTDGECSSSFTSSARGPVTTNSGLAITEQELQDQRWQTVRKMKKKGLVRLSTNYGDINVEVHCDFVPQTSDNFMSLCASKYYDGVLFHRVIQGFMMQGGDPTGTGRGGESIWKKPFRDEIDSRLSHDARGILSMANAGPGTNRSQFFITFKPCQHLDKKHAVFGRVVGGMEVVDAIERVETGAEDRPVEEVKINRVDVFVNPFQEYEDAKSQGNDVLQLLKVQRAEAAKPKAKGTVVKVGNDWVAYDDLGDADIAAIPSKETSKEEGVGKYLKASKCGGAGGNKAIPTKRSHASEDTSSAVPAAIEGKKKQKVSTSGGFGNFSGW